MADVGGGFWAMPTLSESLKHKLSLCFWIEIPMILMAISIRIMFGYSNHQQEKEKKKVYTAIQVVAKPRIYL